MNPDFREFFELLLQHGVQIAVIGGVAYNHYAAPRATKDIDVWVEPTRANLERLVAAIAQFGFPADQIDMEALSTARPPHSDARAGSESYRRTPAAAGHRVERERSAFRGRELSQRADPNPRSGGPHRAKRAAGRPQDLVDTMQLERIAHRAT